MNGCSFHDVPCNCPIKISLNDVERAAMAELLVARINQIEWSEEQFMLMGLFHKMAENNPLITLPIQ